MVRTYPEKKESASLHKSVPKWIRQKKEDVEKLVVDLSKQKYSSAKIGAILRDTHGIPDIKMIAQKPVSKIMQEHNAYPEIPEDLMFMLKKAVELRKHLSSNKQDKHSRRGLQNLESKIRRVAKYYMKADKLPKGWKYDPEQARLIIQKW